MNKKFTGLTSCSLHILAMVLMLFDHLWATFFGDQRWMTGIGRLAFPIFAFMIVEGFAHTSNIKKYLKRLFVFALISEIPFNFLTKGNSILALFRQDDFLWLLRVLLEPFHQNVLWTFLLSLLIILFIEWYREKFKKLAEKIANEKASKAVYWALTGLVSAIVAYIAFVLGNITFVDYFGGGVLTVLVFYFFRERKWWNLLLQIVLIYYINTELIAGMFFPVSMFGFTFEVGEQSLAVLSLIPIWLYRGVQGYHAKWFKYFCYAFYPAHMFILTLLAELFF